LLLLLLVVLLAVWILVYVDDVDDDVVRVDVVVAVKDESRFFSYNYSGYSKSGGVICAKTTAGEGGEDDDIDDDSFAAFVFAFVVLKVNDYNDCLASYSSI
jgi:predicted outer membrane repeat protein